MFNKDNLKYFTHPQEADKWVWCIEHGVGDWVKRQGEKKKGDQSFWKLVLWVSQTYLRILNKNVTQRQFAQLLIEECPHALNEGVTVDKLFHNMENSNEPLAVAYREHTAEAEQQGWHRNTHLCVNLKTLLRSDRCVKEGKSYTGVLRHDVTCEEFRYDDHFTFVESEPQTTFKRNPQVFSGRYVTIIR